MATNQEMLTTILKQLQSNEYTQGNTIETLEKSSNQKFLEQYIGIQNSIQREDIAYFTDESKTHELKVFLETHFKTRTLTLYKSVKQRFEVLLVAADKGAVGAIRELLAMPGLMPNAYINRQDSTYGYSALMRAAARGHLDVVLVLLNQGAKTELENKKENNVYFITAKNKKTDCLDAILKHSGPPKNVKKTFAACGNDEETLRILFSPTSNRLNVDSRNGTEEMPLLVQSIQGLGTMREVDESIFRPIFQRIKLLLELGASPNTSYQIQTPDQTSGQPLHKTAFQMVGEIKHLNTKQRLELLELMLKFKANPNDLFQTALEAQDVETIRLLLKYNATSIYWDKQLKSHIPAGKHISDLIDQQKKELKELNQIIKNLNEFPEKTVQTLERQAVEVGGNFLNHMGIATGPNWLAPRVALASQGSLEDRIIKQKQQYSKGIERVKNKLQLLEMILQVIQDYSPLFILFLGLRKDQQQPGNGKPKPLIQLRENTLYHETAVIEGLRPFVTTW